MGSQQAREEDADPPPPTTTTRLPFLFNLSRGELVRRQRLIDEAVERLRRCGCDIRRCRGGGVPCPERRYVFDLNSHAMFAPPSIIVYIQLVTIDLQVFPMLIDCLGLKRFGSGRGRFENRTCNSSHDSNKKKILSRCVVVCHSIMVIEKRFFLRERERENRFYKPNLLQSHKTI